VAEFARRGAAHPPKREFCAATPRRFHEKTHGVEPEHGAPLLGVTVDLDVVAVVTRARRGASIEAMTAIIVGRNRTKSLRHCREQRAGQHSAHPGDDVEGTSRSRRCRCDLCGRSANENSRRTRCERLDDDDRCGARIGRHRRKFVVEIFGIQAEWWGHEITEEPDPATEVIVRPGKHDLEIGPAGERPKNGPAGIGNDAGSSIEA
jgi:hypothetical protein